MEINSSGEELIVKTRKPYTITKQRERWTDEEHNRFLEALKLYGRAWQRIEDHIGTKTAVQIRSHAQKFFTKLEKESVSKGIPMGQTHVIDIPPPRPKRKPCNPYPRKIGACCASPAAEAEDENMSKSVNFKETIKEGITLKRNALIEVSAVTKSVQGINVCSDEGNCSALLNLFQETPSASVSSGHKGTTNPINFKEFVPTVNEPKDVSSDGGSSLSFEINVKSSMNGRNKPDHALGTINEISKDLHAIQKSSDLGEISGVQMQLVNQSQNGSQKDDRNHKDQKANVVQSTNTHRTNSEVSESIEFPSIACPFTNSTIPAAPGLQASLPMSSILPPFVTFPPFAHFRSTQDVYRSFLGMSSTFSSLIVSTLLQNPAVHVAAQMATSLWPSGEMDSLTDSSSMAAAAAATVAAAAAWWASHGLVPFFPPIHAAGLSFPLQNNAIPKVNTGQFSQDKMEKREAHQNSSKTDQQDVSTVRTRDLNSQPSASKSVLSSSSDTEEIENEASDVNNLKQVTGTAAYDNSDNSKISKKPERSSCGSNTPSSSEVETEAAIKTNGETNNEAQQVPFQNLSMSEVNTRRARSSGSMNDSWKEVSQEGRVAFQALFARDILPQTFLLQQAKVELGYPKDMLVGRDNVSQNGFLPNEIMHGNLKVRRTGFKPYKRCSAEAEANMSSANDETSSKRIRLEGEASL